MTTIVAIIAALIAIPLALMLIIASWKLLFLVIEEVFG
jgi:hypothetical protein